MIFFSSGKGPHFSFHDWQQCWAGQLLSCLTHIVRLEVLSALLRSATAGGDEDPTALLRRSSHIAPFYLQSLFLSHAARGLSAHAACTFETLDSALSRCKDGLCSACLPRLPGFPLHINLTHLMRFLYRKWSNGR